MILLFSGGLDSYIAWHYLGKPRTLYCDIGHRYAAQEIEAVKKLVPDTIIDSRLRLSDWEKPDAHIPLRNAFFCMIASHYDKEIVLVVQKGEMDLPDRSHFFMGIMSGFLTVQYGSSKSYIVLSPFDHMTKTQMVKWYLESDLSREDLLSTRSCFDWDDGPCGNCAACFRRWIAFANSGLREEYRSPIQNYVGIQEYIHKMRAGMYDKERVQETFAVFKREGLL